MERGRRHDEIRVPRDADEDMHGVSYGGCHRVAPRLRVLHLPRRHLSSVDSRMRTFPIFHEHAAAAAASLPPSWSDGCAAGGSSKTPTMSTVHGWRKGSAAARGPRARAWRRRGAAAVRGRRWCRRAIGEYGDVEDERGGGGRKRVR
ncbi:hypothetical protein ACP70R_037242 [Stipagrostis hirtigluma subsp. patula]